MLPDIQRVTQIKIPGIAVANYLSINEHVRDVICKCGQSPYAIKVLRSHGLNLYCKLSIWSICESAYCLKEV